MTFESMRQKVIPPTSSRSSTSRRPPSPPVCVLPSCSAGKTIDGSALGLLLNFCYQEPVLTSLDRGGSERTLRDGIDERAGPVPCSFVLPLRIQVPKLRLIVFIAQIIDQIVAAVANEASVLLDGLD